MALRPTLLIDSLKKSDCFVVCFNESLNDVLQSCEIDLLLRYFDFDDFTVKICYCDSRFFGHATHQYLVKQCNDGMKQLDVNKLLLIFMDGSSVNHKFLEEVSKERKGNNSINLLILVVMGSTPFMMLLKLVMKMPNGLQSRHQRSISSLTRFSCKTR